METQMCTLQIRGLMEVLDGPYLNLIAGYLLLELPLPYRYDCELNATNVIEQDSLYARTFNLVCLFRLAALSFKPVQSSS